MKKEICKKTKNYFSIARINFLLLIVFTILNQLDYFSTYLSLLCWGIEINPVVRFMLDIPLLFFVWKILVFPLIVWKFVYESESKWVIWGLIGVDLVYLGVFWWNLRVVF